MWVLVRSITISNFRAHNINLPPLPRQSHATTLVWPCLQTTTSSPDYRACRHSHALGNCFCWLRVHWVVLWQFLLGSILLFHYILTSLPFVSSTSLVTVDFPFHFIEIWRSSQKSLKSFAYAIDPPWPSPSICPTACIGISTLLRFGLPLLASLQFHKPLPHFVVYVKGLGSSLSDQLE